MWCYSSTLAWKIPWMQEPGRLQSMGSLRVGHDWATSLSRIGGGNGNPLQCSCLENPRDGGAWWAAVYGVPQSWTPLKRLSSSSKSKGSGLIKTVEWTAPNSPHFQEKKKKKSRNCKNQLSWFQQTKFCSNHRNAESKEGNLEIGKFCAIFTGPAHHLPGSQKVPHVACIPGLGPWALVSEGAEQSASTDDCVCLSWSVWQLPEDWHMPSTCFT